jgi:hypothetical protein
MSARKWQRRCLNFRCTNWVPIDPGDPAGELRRFCSPACETEARREIQRTEREIAAAEYLAAHPRQRYAPARYRVGDYANLP